MERIKITWDLMDSYTSVPMEYRFIDNAEVIPGKEAWGKKSVSSQDWYFKMHFPGNPVMPGVLLMETLQQTGLLIVTTLPDIKEKIMLFHRCQNMRMFHSVRPGDVLQTHIILDSFKRGIADFHGEVEIDRFGEEKRLKACTMEFTMLLRNQMIPIPREKIVQRECGGVKNKYDWSNFDSYLADPPEYRFIDFAEVYGDTACGMKNVSSQDWYFSILSDDRKMPFGFIMEAIMQTGVLIVTQREDVRNPLMMFSACKNVIFYEHIRPGDKLKTEVELKSFRGGVANYVGTAYVDNKIACGMKFVLIHPDEIGKISDALNRKKEDNQIC